MSSKVKSRARKAPASKTKKRRAKAPVTVSSLPETDIAVTTAGRIIQRETGLRVGVRSSHIFATALDDHAETLGIQLTEKLRGTGKHRTVTASMLSSFAELQCMDASADFGKMLAVAPVVRAFKRADPDLRLSVDAKKLLINLVGGFARRVSRIAGDIAASSSKKTITPAIMASAVRASAR